MPLTSFLNRFKIFHKFIRAYGSCLRVETPFSSCKLASMTTLLHIFWLFVQNIWSQNIRAYISGLREIREELGRRDPNKLKSITQLRVSLIRLSRLTWAKLVFIKVGPACARWTDMSWINQTNFEARFGFTMWDDMT